MSFVANTKLVEVLRMMDPEFLVSVSALFHELEEKEVIDTMSMTVEDFWDNLTDALETERAEGA